MSLRRHGDIGDDFLQLVHFSFQCEEPHIAKILPPFGRQNDGPSLYENALHLGEM